MRLERDDRKETLTTKGVDSTGLLTVDVRQKDNDEDTLQCHVIGSWLRLFAIARTCSIFAWQKRELDDHEIKSYFITSLDLKIETDMRCSNGNHGRGEGDNTRGYSDTEKHRQEIGEIRSEIIIIVRDYCWAQSRHDKDAWKKSEKR